MSMHGFDIFVGPALLVVWLIDMYVFLVLFRVALYLIPLIAHSLFGRGIRRLTDTFPHAIHHMLKQPVDSLMWLPWLIAMVTVILTRYLIICLVVEGYTPV